MRYFFHQCFQLAGQAINLLIGQAVQVRHEGVIHLRSRRSCTCASLRPSMVAFGLEVEGGGILV
jgi:hypothetical protein